MDHYTEQPPRITQNTCDGKSIEANLQTTISRAREDKALSSLVESDYSSGNRSRQPRIYRIIVLHENDKLTKTDSEQQQPTIKPTIHGDYSTETINRDDQSTIIYSYNLWSTRKRIMPQLVKTLYVSRFFLSNLLPSFFKLLKRKLVRLHFATSKSLKITHRFFSSVRTSKNVDRSNGQTDFLP